MSLLLWMVLQWTFVCMHLYGRMIYIHLGIYSVMGLLGWMVVLLLAFWGITILLSTMVELIYTSTNSMWVFLFLCNLVSICYFLTFRYFFTAVWEQTNRGSIHPKFMSTWNLRMWPHLKLRSLQMSLVKMMSYWIRMDPSSMTVSLLERRGHQTHTHTHTHTQGRYHVNTKAEIGVVQL